MIVSSFPATFNVEVYRYFHADTTLFFLKCDTFHLFFNLDYTIFALLCLPFSFVRVCIWMYAQKQVIRLSFAT